MKSKLDAVRDALNDERGVSPVIGVILMVAITVILAAVIGTFVLGLGSEVSSSAPSASISVQDHSENATNITETTANGLIELEHSSGDKLVDGDYQIQIRQGTSGSYETIYDGSPTNNLTISGVSHQGGASPGSSDVDIGFKPNSAPDGDLSVGDVIGIFATPADDGGTGTSGVDISGKYQIQIIHKQSESTVVSKTVDVS